MTFPINNTSDTGRATDYATEHYNSGTGSTNGTNAYINLTNAVARTVYNSTYDIFAVIWIGLTLNSQAFMSGEITIQRQ